MTQVRTTAELAIASVRKDPATSPIVSIVLRGNLNRNSFPTLLSGGRMRNGEGWRANESLT